MAGSGYYWEEGQRQVNGKVEYFHAWPLATFKEFFHGFRPEDTDDWKAVIYKSGGPKPSCIERTDLEFRPEDGRILILYWLREGVRYTDRTGGYTGARWF